MEGGCKEGGTCEEGEIGRSEGKKVRRRRREREESGRGLGVKNGKKEGETRKGGRRRLSERGNRKE